MSANFTLIIRLTLIKVICIIRPILSVLSNNKIHLMSKSKTVKIWFCILFLPSIFSLLGLILVLTAYVFDLESSQNIPVTQLVGLLFAELTMVVSGLGIVAYIKSMPKTVLSKSWVYGIRCF